MPNQYAVLGSPISHSKSPAIHAAAYRVLGLDWEYSAQEVKKGGLRPFIESLDETWSGFSVTMPLKEDAFRFADSTDRLSEITGASNTLLKNKDGWVGFNTDVYGIIQAIEAAGIATPKTVLIIGSGATANSAMAAMLQLAPKAKIRVQARNEQARAALVKLGLSIGLRVAAVRNLKRAIQNHDLVISTLPAHALDDFSNQLLNRRRAFVPKGSLFDVAYEPWPSQLSKLWSRNRRVVVPGIEMLLWQAIAQIRIFTNGNPEDRLPQEAAMLEAMRHATMWQN